MVVAGALPHDPSSTSSAGVIDNALTLEGIMPYYSWYHASLYEFSDIISFRVPISAHVVCAARQTRDNVGRVAPFRL